MERLFEFAANHWILSSLFVTLISAILWNEGRRAGKKLTPQQVIGLMNKDMAVLVDVRDRKEYGEGRITGSIHMPLSSVKERASELKKHEGKTVVVVDKMGQHAATASKQLSESGIANVVRLAGGIVEWKASSLPLVKK